MTPRAAASRRRTGWWVLAALLLLIALAAPFLLRRGMELLYPRRYGEIVEAEAAEFSLDPALVYGVIRCESGFDAAAVSHAGARGLMQLTDRTFEWMVSLSPPENGGADPLDVRDNIHCGCALLRLLLDEFGGEREALAAYNAGMGNVALWLQDPACSADGAVLAEIPFPETRAYVLRVQRSAAQYNRLYFSQPDRP